MMRRTVSVFVFLFCLLLLVQPSLAAINPKTIESATVRITKNGTLTPTGTIQSASLTLYIAQEGQTGIDVSPNDWEYANDANGNRMVRIHFRDFSQPQPYSVVQTLKSNAQRLDAEAPLDGDARYTAETSGAQLTINVSATAYPFERTLKGVAGMASWVHGYVKYDKSLFGQSKPSDWVLANKRGVCIEFTNLLAAMLRSRGIAARYVNGYAYSSEDGGLIGHAWLEVLSSGSGSTGSPWVGFDPTWLEGGLIDATHVKTSVSDDGVEKETLSYLGNGKVVWNKNPDVVEMLEYSTSNDTSIMIEAPENLPLEGGGFVKATTSSTGCRITQLRASSCTGSRDKELLALQGGARELWVCGSASVFWAFTNSLGGGYTYNCPVLVYDQLGAQAEKAISIGGESAGPMPTINGPDSAGVNRPFTIQASFGMLFSTELGQGSSPWTLTLMEPGTYDFYAYANGRLAHKAVEVRSAEEFELVASAPDSVNQSATFLVTATLGNIGAAAKAVTVKAVFANQTLEQQASLGAGQSETFRFNFTAYDAGSARYTVSALSDSYTGYSGSVSVIPAPEKPKGFLDAIISAIQDFLSWLRSVLGL